jgi:hypothetical protein
MQYVWESFRIQVRNGKSGEQRYGDARRMCLMDSRWREFGLGSVK